MTQQQDAIDSHIGFQRYLLNWFKTPIGQYALEFERTLIDQHLNHLFGYYLVQMGRVSETSLLATSRIKNHILVDETLTSADQVAERLVLANLMAQPFAASSIDLILLPHTLESTLDPYRFIRYVDELIRADGHLVITGFNPLSCLVLRQRMGQDKAQWRAAHIIKMERLVDWLRLLGYDVLVKEYSLSRCFESKVNQKFQPIMRYVSRMGQPLTKLGLSMSQSYIVVAKKQQWVPLRPHKASQLSEWVSGSKPVVAQSRHTKASSR
ncbi:hypothetical protein THIAE_05560 [Thiomicrospira aerophila AL3]|uniref:Methyltransferase type 11 domain-containing protein n=1 Tax=Thiomicrospira aerophila AL3 TaxID=717772 RepID=W0DRT1_9GAMM|nr:methyltransferase domain-containing protein [Thiomicrospira aerophila]AHF01335.1 hypothetical protein THIAE_05560 [Thiomicrospira aerophila AL3]